MTLEQLREEYITSITDHEKEHENSLTVSEVTHLFDGVKQHGANGLFYAIGIAYNKGYAAATKNIAADNEGRA